MKIVSLSPSLTEILVHLKASDTLVGVSDACPVNGKERVGNPKALRRDQMESLNPDWIVADTQESRPEEVERLQEKWKMKLFEVKSLQGVLDTVAELGRLVARPDEAKRLNESIRSEIAASEAAFQGKEKKRTVLLTWNQPYLTVNFDTYPSRLIEASGGMNVFRKEPLAEFPVELEEMIERSPELLLLYAESSRFQKKHIARFRQYRIFSKIPIRLIEGRLLSRYGPNTIEALGELRKVYKNES